MSHSADPAITPAGRYPVRVRLEREAGTCTVDSDHTLAVIGFGDGDAPATSAPCFGFRVPLQPLGEHAPLEIWESQAPVTDRGETGRIRYAATDEFLFGVAQVDDPPGADVAALTRSLYDEVLGFVAARPQRHVLRMWNYVRDINHGDGDDERYRRFCIGRYEAFRSAFDEESAYPAATAIGSTTPRLHVSFICATTPGQTIENPRQVSAYRYPRQYGPRSPSFSRATLHAAAPGRSLFVSGTASVVGHETRHRDTVRAQMQETAINLDAMHTAGGQAGELQKLRVYLRDAADLDNVKAELNCYPDIDGPAVYVLGDICRADLLLEIEAFYGS